MLKNKKQCVIISAAMLVIYAAITLIGALNHELWFDETQAWNIARDNDIAGIIGMMKYEGHPPLWHFILYPFAHAGFSCEILPIISWVFMTITAALVLFKLPITLPLKAVVIFSGGFIYTNSVISRTYCLIPLLLCLIALTYKNRRKHPLLFGLLVALLANTHVCMSGMVGILGIFMIIDLIKEWKTSAMKENALRVAGLLISGIGVLMLVLPLLSSISTNVFTSQYRLSASKIVSSVPKSFFQIALFGSSISGEKNIYVLLPSMLIMLCMIGMLVFLRKYLRAFFMELTFLLLYVITCEIVFYTNANRATMVLFSFVFALCIANGEKPVRKPPRELKADTKLIRSLISLFSKLDKNALRTYELLLTAVMALTIPAGAIYLIQDYTEEFNPVKKAVRFILDELPSDAVFVTGSDTVPQFSAYCPDIKLYSLQHGGFYTYTSHKIVDEKIDYAKVQKDLSGYENIYYINAFERTEETAPDESKLFTNYVNMQWLHKINYVDIETYDLAEFNDME